MNIDKFVGLLSPSIDRSRILESIESIRIEMNKNVFPPFNEAALAKLFPTQDAFKDAHIRRYNGKFINAMGLNKGTFVEVAARIYSEILNNLPVLEKRVTDFFRGREVNRIAITYSQATFLRLISLINFSMEYGTMFLLYVYGKEFPATTKASFNEPFAPGDVKWIESKFDSWCKVMKMLTNPIDQILIALEKMPESVVDPATVAQVSQVTGPKALDPLSMGFIPVLSPAIMFVIRNFYEYQALSLKRSEERARSLELRLAQYRAFKANGNRDAANDALILKTEQRLRDLNYKIVKEKKAMGIEE